MCPFLSSLTCIALMRCLPWWYFSQGRQWLPWPPNPIRLWFSLFAFERECIKQQKHKNKLLYMMVQPTIFNVSFQCHLYSICTMPQLFHNDKRHLTCAAYGYNTLTDNAYLRCFKFLGQRWNSINFQSMNFYNSILQAAYSDNFPFCIHRL